MQNGVLGPKIKGPCAHLLCLSLVPAVSLGRDVLFYWGRGLVKCLRVQLGQPSGSPVLASTACWRPQGDDRLAVKPWILSWPERVQQPREAGLARCMQT